MWFLALESRGAKLWFACESGVAAQKFPVECFPRLRNVDAALRDLLCDVDKAFSLVVQYKGFEVFVWDKIRA